MQAGIDQQSEQCKLYLIAVIIYLYFTQLKLIICICFLNLHESGNAIVILTKFKGHGMAIKLEVT